MACFGYLRALDDPTLSPVAAAVFLGGLFLLGGLGLCLWYLPVHIAREHQHRYTAPITLIVLCFGWTFIGWFVALAWACSQEQWTEHHQYHGPIKSYNMFT
jgi:hypothetical protein